MIHNATFLCFSSFDHPRKISSKLPRKNPSASSTNLRNIWVSSPLKISPLLFLSSLLLPSSVRVFLNKPTFPSCSSHQQAWAYNHSPGCPRLLPCLWSCSLCRKGSPPLLTEFHSWIPLENATLLQLIKIIKGGNNDKNHIIEPIHLV